MSTYWNGLPTLAERGSAEIDGERIAVVRVVLDGVNYGGGEAYLDDRDGSGWRKVTNGLGLSRHRHRNVAPVPGTFEATDE
jgi:hypothetical protein